MTIEWLTNNSLLKEAGLRIEDLNYERVRYPIRKRVGGVSYVSFDLVAGDELLRDRLLANATAGDVVYDVGAKTGDYTLPLAAAGCTVYAFEPNPRTFERLERHVELNDLGDADLLNVGVSDEDDELTFYQSSRRGRSSFNRYNAEYGDAEVIATSTVDVVRIDTLVDRGRIEPPDHLKVDVEGLGLEVLRGARATIERSEPTIYFEPHEVEDGNVREDELLAFFDDVGYAVEQFDYPWICTPEDRSSGTDARSGGTAESAT